MKKKISLETLSGLNGRATGLSAAEVTSQRSRFGANAIIERTGNPWLELFVDTIKDPMIWFLIGIGTAFFLVGDRQEAIILFLATIPLLFMDAFLHWRTQASTASLKGQLAADALVIRDGERLRIDSHDIVPGDLVVLNSEEHFLPADGFWESVDSLQVDESVLTGEAFPITKRTIPFDAFRSAQEVLVDSQSLGFAGTRILTGSGLLRILFTGKNTSYGEIVQSVSTIAHERTALQHSIAKLTKRLIYAAAAFCLILALIRVYQGHGWLDALLSAATLAVAAMPEEFPVVFSFFLGVGVYRLAKRGALVRRAVSVENIGRITRICTDKTGTITAGQLKLTHVDAASPFSESEVLSHAGAASNHEGTDPVDQAIFALSGERDLKIPLRTSVIPFTEDRKRETAFYENQGSAFCAMKGSPETILSKSALSSEEKNKWLDRTSNWAREGHKLLAVGNREVSAAELRDGKEPDSGFQFAGLLAFEDPARPEVRPAIEYCGKNGIKVLMITGDHPQTAAAIAKDVGLGSGQPIVISAEADPEKFEADWLKANPEFLRGADVIARCNPIQKLRVVEALKSSGEIVAVTGDGVNDVPALKAADIGIAMGVRGTRSAKEVSSIILSDDNFSTIVNAIREGRQLFSNLRLSFEYLLLFHIPFVLSAALVPLLGYPLLYLPAHVVWLELIIHPTALFAFQQAATSENDGAPERRVSFFDKRDALLVLLVGLAVTTALITSFVTGLSENSDANHGRAKIMALLALWSAGLAVFLTKGKSRPANIIAAASLLCSVLLIQVKWLAGPLHLTPLHGLDWLKVFGTVAAAIAILFILRKRFSSR
ncbi:MAG: cation-transporting P-type ATPase [Bdellovibrionaceae bacterium]|nr:cation-transporting P-type ATPase [Pseudobdellovibrionaceae bacterium]MBX3033822.1 cation-transporting P-type ATPase [Pseudobdellovibrionaceae bacterium]